ncbi:MAG TPA: cobalt-precorrin-5B (C(1))-methyltransferase CbiD [Candidatus Avalokitesvara rifleensis]|uniref:cobalt-precorrin-5B (C(1))-methyltransferase CbiD n=1 Tax=Candidatus Avalokitesvara rifleensis TaxID=3367620 RepID=UPI00402594FE
MINVAHGYGFTTGTCAAGAARAAAQGLAVGSVPDSVEVVTPSGITAKLRILGKTLNPGHSASCAVKKDAGDDPDVTHGCLVFARVEPCPEKGVAINGGEGVGTVTKPGLRVAPGEAAINPVPRNMIRESVKKFMRRDTGLRVTVSVPGGEEIAEKTFNPRLGILGGISIIGTTGIVRPMSQESHKVSLVCALDVASAMGHETVVLVPGNLGENAFLRTFKVPAEQVVQISNYLGFMLVEAKKKGFPRIILAGHPGKLAKFIRGDLDTHSLKSSPAMDIVIKILEENGLEESIVGAVKDSPTVEGIIQQLRERDKLFMMENIADIIEGKAREFLGSEIDMGVVLFDMQMDVIGISKGAKGWQKGLQIA